MKNCKSKQLLPIRETMVRTSKSRTAVYDGMAQGTFPKCVKTGKRSVAWVEEEIDAYIETLIAARDVNKKAGVA